MLTKKNLKTLLYFGGAMGVTSLIPFIMLPILTKELSIEEYGVLALIEISILFMIPFVSLKIESGIGVHYFRLGARNFKLYVVNALFISTVAFFILLIILFVFSNELSEVIGLSPFYIAILPVFAVLRVISSVMLTLFRSKEQPQNFFYLSFFQSMIDLALSLILVVLFKWGIEGRLTAVYTAFFIITVWGVFYFYRNGYFNYWSYKYIKNIIAFSFPLIPHALAGVVIVMSDRYFIAYFFSSAEVGLYSVSYQVGAVMLLFGTIINQFLGPKLYGYLKNRSFDEANKMGIIIAVVLVTFSILVFGIQDFLYLLLVDEKFISSKVFFSWLLVGFLFQSLYFVATNYLFFYGKTALLAKLTVTAALLNLFLNYLLIESFSVIGVAYATAITWLILFLMVFVTVQSRKQQWEIGN